MPRPLVPEGDVYNVIEYDVWGNAKEGYSINDMWKTGQVIRIPDNATDNQIVKVLIAERLLKPRVRASQLVIAFTEDGIEIGDAKKEEPLFGLQLVSKENED